MKTKKKQKPMYNINGKLYKNIPKNIEVVEPSNKSKFMQAKGLTNKDLDNPIIASMIDKIKENDEQEETLKQQEYYKVAGNDDGEISVLENQKSNNGGLPISSGLMGVQEQTELGQALIELNKDEVEPNSRATSIDMRARLHHLEVSSILAVDTLVSMRFLPVSCLVYTRQKKRLSVSSGLGAGRREIVDIVRGKKDDENAGKPLTKFFGGQQQQT